MSAAPAGRIGPNAIVQVTGALRDQIGPEAAAQLVRAVGLGSYLDAPPRHMVDEREVISLHRAVREFLGVKSARNVARLAGHRTAEYLLAHRIPRLAQCVLRILPAWLASRLLLTAVVRHAWTFAGSGRFGARQGHPVVVSIQDCPICRGMASPAPVCDYYAATFERLFRQLVHPACRVVESECQAAGAPHCRFEIRWRN